MKTRLSALVTVLCLVAFTAGCYSTVDGRKHAGKPFSRDRIESRYERPAEDLFAAAKDVLLFNGNLTSENTVARTLEAKVDNNTVWVQVEDVEPDIARVYVQVRKRSGGGNLVLASEIDKQIALQVQAR